MQSLSRLLGHSIHLLAVLFRFQLVTLVPLGIQQVRSGLLVARLLPECLLNLFGFLEPRGCTTATTTIRRGGAADNGRHARRLYHGADRKGNGQETILLLHKDTTLYAPPMCSVTRLDAGTLLLFQLLLLRRCRTTCSSRSVAGRGCVVVARVVMIAHVA